MGDPALLESGIIQQTFGGNGAAGTDVALGTSHTKGSWVQLGTKQLAFDGRAITVCWSPETQTTTSMIDIGMMPPGGSQIVLIPNLFCALNSDNNTEQLVIHFPIHVPRGMELWARGQAGSGVSAEIEAIVHGGGRLTTRPYTKVLDMGTDLSNSLGTDVDPGGSADTKGSWVLLHAAAPFDMKMIGILPAQNNSTLADTNWNLDIGIGTSGSQVAVIPDVFVTGSAALDCCTPRSVDPLPVDIPRGSSVWARLQCDITTSLDRNLYIAAYGVG